MLLSVTREPQPTITPLRGPRKEPPERDVKKNNDPPSTGPTQMDEEPNPSPPTKGATTTARERSLHRHPSYPAAQRQPTTKVCRQVTTGNDEQDAEAKRLKAGPPLLTLTTRSRGDGKRWTWGEPETTISGVLPSLYSAKGRIDAKKAATEGAWFRAQAKLHAENHADRFSDLSFQSWLKAAGKQATYAEGALSSDNPEIQG